MKQACVYTMGDKLVAIAPLGGLGPKEEEFDTYYIGSGNTIAEAVGYAIMDWLGYSSCRHANVETQEDVGGEEYIHNPGEFTPALKFLCCKDCGEIL